MQDYGKIRNTMQPEPKVVDEYSVWVNSDIHEVKVEHEGETYTEFEYHQVCYTKDEYIAMMDAKNTELETNMTNAELALVELYEMIGG